MTKEDRIRAEINRRLSSLQVQKGQGIILTEEIRNQLTSLLSFIDHIHGEPKIKDMNEAAIRSAYTLKTNWPGSDVKAHIRGFKAGVEWMAEQCWIDDGRMPTEKKEESDTLQGHHEWTASEPVLAWDSMYGPRIDFTRNGKWVSETKGGYTGQVCHGIVAWMPIPQYKQ